MCCIVVGTIFQWHVPDSALCLSLRLDETSAMRGIDSVRYALRTCSCAAIMLPIPFVRPEKSDLKFAVISWRERFLRLHPHPRTTNALTYVHRGVWWMQIVPKSAEIAVWNLQCAKTVTEFSFFLFRFDLSNDWIGQLNAILRNMLLSVFYALPYTKTQYSYYFTCAQQTPLNESNWMYFVYLRFCSVRWFLSFLCYCLSEDCSNMVWLRPFFWFRCFFFFFVEGVIKISNTMIYCCGFFSWQMSSY